MKLLSMFTFICILSSSLFSFSDQDIDGVDDAHDLCSNTPFDLTVNKKGCPYNQNNTKHFIFQIGEDINFNSSSEKTNTLNLFLNYTYKKWDFSLSSSNYNTTNINTIFDTEDDFYLTTGYLLEKNKFKTKIAIGTKFAFMDNDSIKRDNDYFISINMDYFINQKQNIFFYPSYTWSGDSNTTQYKNFYSFSLGTGYALTSKWYSAFSYNYTQLPYNDIKPHKSISWVNYYILPHDFYIYCNYAYTLNKSSYTHLVSLNIGVKF